MLPEPRFALMTQGKDQDRLLGFTITIKRDITGTPARDDQFAQPMFHAAANQWVVNKHLHGFLDQRHRVDRRRRIASEQKIHQTLKILQRLMAVIQDRHDLATGGSVVRPRARARMYRCTSVAA